MSASASRPGSRASTEPSSTVSALTGFDPSRKSDVFRLQLDMQRRAAAFDNGVDAAKGLQWLNEYGLRILNGSTFGDGFGGAEEAKLYLNKARAVFAEQILNHAIGLAAAAVEAAYASALEARSDATGTGAAEGESAAPSGETPRD